MNAPTGIISGIRVSHEHASVDDIAAASRPDQETAVDELLAHESVSEAFALQTCNRAEAYVVTDTATAGRSALAAFAPDTANEVVEKMGHEESLRHLMRVAAGLESLVLGEDQIIGQVRTAYEDSRLVGGIGPVLEDAVTKAIHVGERARTETKINEGSTSVGSAAVSLAAQERDLSDGTALVVGAGEMGRLAAHAFARSDVETVYVANRSLPSAERLAADLEVADARPVGLEALPTVLRRADVVVSATGSSEYVLDADLLREAGSVFVIDIAQPRDVSPAADALDGVVVRSLDALESVTDATMKRRREAARTVEAMIDREFEHLQDQYKRKQADEAIARMYESADRLKGREVETALTKLDARGGLTEDQREVVQSMADALVSHLLAPPTKSLRQAAADDDWTTINTALQLFNPEFNEELAAMLGPLDDASAEAVANVADDD